MGSKILGPGSHVLGMSIRKTSKGPRFHDLVAYITLPHISLRGGLCIKPGTSSEFYWLFEDGEGSAGEGLLIMACQKGSNIFGPFNGHLKRYESSEIQLDCMSQVRYLIPNKIKIKTSFQIPKNQQIFHTSSIFFLQLRPRRRSSGAANHPGNTSRPR